MLTKKMKVTAGLNFCRARLCYLTIRQCSQKQGISSNLPKSSHGRNIVGPPDKESNLRPTVYYIPENESHLEKQFRLTQIDTQERSQTFWAAHNNEFYKAKEDFVTKKLHENKEKSGGEAADILTPEEMSIFYKKFLDENFAKHMEYQKWWYKRNIQSLWPALKISVRKLFKK